MNIQTFYQKAPMTLLCILSFVCVALSQLLLGVNFDQPSFDELIRFGANFLPLTLADEPWRLLSGVFLHIGLIHLLLNSFAMYYFGQVVEGVVGRSLFLAVFLLSAIGGNLLSLFVTWQSVMNGGLANVSAGASGGIMGLGSFLLVVAIFKIPTAFVLDAKNLFIVMAINLVMGFALPGIDNARHVGGVFVLSSKTTLPKMSVWVLAVLLLVAFVLIWWQLHMQLWHDD